MTPGFDGASAYAYLVKQTRFGPRGPGMEGHAKCLSYLQAELRKYAADVWTQDFESGLSERKSVHLTNVIASFGQRSSQSIFISAHWDSRLWADQDPDKSNHTKPILGANDGASGVAVILEIARQLRKAPPRIGVDLILFDGEDLGKTGKPESFSAGAKYFAAHMPAAFKPKFGINIDMVGDRNLEISREVNSEQLAPDIQNLVFSTAKSLNIYQFIDIPGEEITDDHLPLNNAGIPTVDLIDFSYPDATNKYWHTLADTADKCCAESLAAVGNVLLKIIYSQ